MDKSFLTGSSKAAFASHLQAAAKSAALKLARYQLSSKVNMGRAEFLRDVVFLGAALVESGKSGTPYYQALVGAAFDITMAGASVDFEDSFIKKVSGAKYAYYLGQEFSATGF
jgi:F420-dependent methylenetetrahydromethanopterin dehydrogenase